jgi:hypothetical protein
MTGGVHRCQVALAPRPRPAVPARRPPPEPLSRRPAAFLRRLTGCAAACAFLPTAPPSFFRPSVPVGRRSRCLAASFQSRISNMELSPAPSLLNRTPTLLQCGRIRGPRQSAHGRRSRARVVLCALPRRRRDGRQQHREPPPRRV